MLKSKLFFPKISLFFLFFLTVNAAFDCTVNAALNYSVSPQNTETVSFTTYYPSPHGVYRMLRLYPNNAVMLGSACTNEGEMVYSQTDRQICVCNGANWQPLSGYWTLTGNYLYPRYANWTVGIGSNTSFSSPFTIKHTVTDAVVVAGSGAGNETATFGWSPSNFTFIQGGTWSTSPRSLVLQAGGGSVGIGTTSPDADYKLHVNGKFKASNIKAARATVLGCNAHECSYSNVVSFPTASSNINSAICTSSVNTNSPASPLVSCQITSIASSGGNTQISVRLSREPSLFFPGSVISGNITVNIIAFEP
ncbi:MAG: hypothetical protein PHQ96_03920 [Candidatus Omnitrophica bacterium]|nr:hypothetical protein [Candidatus Omnitrophota bacterium]